MEEPTLDAAALEQRRSALRTTRTRFEEFARLRLRHSDLGLIRGRALDRLSEPSARDRLGAAARESAQRLTWRAHVTRLRELFSQVSG